MRYANGIKHGVKSVINCDEIQMDLIVSFLLGKTVHSK
jgi:hypothetical protein